MDADGHPSAIPHHVIDRASEKEDFILLLTRSSPQVEIVIFTADRNHSTTPPSLAGIYITICHMMALGRLVSGWVGWGTK